MVNVSTSRKSGPNHGTVFVLLSAVSTRPGMLVVNTLALISSLFLFLFSSSLFSFPSMTDSPDCSYKQRAPELICSVSTTAASFCSQVCGGALGLSDNAEPSFSHGNPTITKSMSCSERRWAGEFREKHLNCVRAEPPAVSPLLTYGPLGVSNLTGLELLQLVAAKAKFDIQQCKKRLMYITFPTKFNHPVTSCCLLFDL